MKPIPSNLIHKCAHKFEAGKMVTDLPILTADQLGEAFARLTKSLKERNISNEPR